MGETENGGGGWTLTEVAAVVFAIGSGMFTVDGLIYVGEAGLAEASFHPWLYTCGSALFLAGSLIWLRDERGRRLTTLVVLVGRVLGVGASEYVGEYASDPPTDQRWLPLDSPLRLVPHAKPWPASVYPTHPDLLRFHTTRPHGSCPHAFTDWNEHVDKEVAMRAGNSSGSSSSSSSGSGGGSNDPDHDHEDGTIGPTGGGGTAAPGTDLSHWSNVSPWLLTFDAALLKRGWWDAHGEIEACCKIWAGEPAFLVRGPTPPRTLYMFQPCGNHRRDYQDALLKHVLPRLSQPVVLYSGGNDCQLHADAVVMQVLNHSMVEHWYTENHDSSLVQHPKLSSVPIGACQRSVVTLSKVGERESAVEALHQGGQQWASRADSVYTCGFKPDWTKPGRMGWVDWAAKRCPKGVCEDPCGDNNLVGQDELYTAYGRHRFALSPRGRGADTYRTWEVLLMGAVPIVPTWGGEDAYAHLPVLAVAQIELVTRELLDAFQAKWRHVLEDPEELRRRLSHDWWVTLVRSGRPAGDPPH